MNLGYLSRQSLTALLRRCTPTSVLRRGCGSGGFGAYPKGRRLCSWQVEAFSFSTQKLQQEDSRKLIEIGQNILPTLLEKNDFASTVELINQMAITLVTQLFKTNRTESKKTLLFILQLVVEIQPHLSKEENESLRKTLKILSQHIDQINDTELIIATDEMHLKFIEKQFGKSNNYYISVLSKLAENCISGDHIDRALQCLQEIEKLAQYQEIAMSYEARIQNKINFGIAYLSKGDSLAAITAYNSALKLTREAKEALHLEAYQIAIFQCLGDIYAKDRQQLDKALQSYEQALSISKAFLSQIDINSLILMFKAANVCFQLKNYAETAKKCQAIEKQLSSNTELFQQFQNYDEMIVLMGEAYNQIGKPALAIQYFERYISKAEKAVIVEERRYCHVINRLIELCLQERRPTEALKHLKSLSKYFKIEGNESAREECEARAKVISASFLAQ